MIPLQLKMSAFGPFAGETVIDFELLNNKGIFLITGETGAGKTTVFDAISFALYGRASGDLRTGTMLRSDFADSGVKTFVVLSFLHKNKRYEVERSPEYKRPKKRGKGDMKEPAGAALYLPDGKVITVVREVDSFIEELLGINRDQFCQTSMIAQGEFLKLLLSGTKNRSGILRKLFETEKYLNFQRNLKEEKIQLERELGNIQERISGILNEIRYFHGDEEISNLKGKIEELTVYENDEWITALKQLRSRHSYLFLHVKEKQEKVQEGRILFNDFFSAYDDLERIRKSIQNQEEVVEEKKRILENAELLLEESEQKALKKEEVEKELALIHSQLPFYRELESGMQSCERIRSELKEEEHRLKDIEEEKSGIEENLKKVEEVLADSLNNLVILERTRNSCEKSERRLGEMEEYDRLQSGIELGAGELKNLKKEYEHFKESLDVLEDQYENEMNDYSINQAAIIAKKLVSGQPCPVCGSKEHPNHAIIPSNTPTEKDLKEKDKKIKKLQKQKQEISGEIHIKELILEQKKEQQAAILEELFSDHKRIDSLMIQKKRIKLQKDFRELRYRIIELEEKEEERREAEKEKDTLTHTLEIIKNRHEKLNQKVLLDKNKLFSLENQISMLKFRLKCDEVQCVFAKMEELQLELRELEEDLKNIKKLHQDAQNEQSASYAVLLERKQQEPGAVSRLERIRFKCYGYMDQRRGEPELTDLMNKKQSLEEELKEWNEERSLLQSIQDNNKRVEDNLKSDILKRKEKEAYYSELKLLSDTANGELSGKPKITFETYLQTAYFSRILDAANKRFRVMTEDRYCLLRRVTADNFKSQSGLEIDVFDYYTGKERDVCSLSGGEAFKASLSLALGFSDIVQQHSGGIRIDAMFIDEGFGTLDGESLDTAVRALNELSGDNRMIGIISHVRELADKIENRIIVKKGRKGSYILIP